MLDSITAIYLKHCEAHGVMLDHHVKLSSVGEIGIRTLLVIEFSEYL